MQSTDYIVFFFFFNDTATTEIYTLSLHDALPIFAFPAVGLELDLQAVVREPLEPHRAQRHVQDGADLGRLPRSEEHTSELQSRSDLVCRLLLEKKKKNQSLEQPLCGLTRYDVQSP